MIFNNLHKTNSVTTLYNSNVTYISVAYLRHIKYGTFRRCSAGILYDSRC